MDTPQTPPEPIEKPKRKPAAKPPEDAPDPPTEILATGPAPNESARPAASVAMPADEVVAMLEREASVLTDAQRRHLHSHLAEATLAAQLFSAAEPVPYQPLSIVFQNVRANTKAFITIRDDQQAIWSEGPGKGLVGLSFSTTRDPVLYVRNFLINAREFYLQTYQDAQEIVVQLYVRTPQPELRGRVDLPPGAVATFQSNTDRTSVVGFSSFGIEF